MDVGAIEKLEASRMVLVPSLIRSATNSIYECRCHLSSAATRPTVKSIIKLMMSTSMLLEAIFNNIFKGEQHASEAPVRGTSSRLIMAKYWMYHVRPANQGP